MRLNRAEFLALAAFLVVVLGAAGVLVAGARGELAGTSPRALAPAAQVLPGVVLAGSGAAIPLVSILASEYRNTTGRSVTVAGSIGSSGGILALKDGVIHGALISRPPSPRESQIWRVLPLARTRVGLAANPSVPFETLTQEQVAAIFRGELSPDLAPILREEGDSGTAIFAAANPVAAEGLLAPHRRLPTAFTDQEMERLLESRPGAIGILDEALVYLKKYRLKTITVTDSGGDRGRTMYLVVPQAPSAELAGFLDFLGSPQAGQFIRASGYEVP